MLVKEIKTTWKSYTLDRGKTHLLYDSKEMSGKKTPHKYLCDIEKVKTGWYKIISKSEKDFPATNETDVLATQIEEYTNSLPYNCELYNSQYREGYFEEIVINDYLYNLGFDSHHSWGNVHYILKRKNIYGGQREEINLSISGLDCFDEIKENVDISLWLGDYSWVSTTCKRECSEIIKNIENLLKPLLLKNSVDDFSKQNELIIGDVKINMKKLSGLDVQSKEYKEELIQTLENTLEELKK